MELNESHFLLVIDLYGVLSIKSPTLITNSGLRRFNCSTATSNIPSLSPPARSEKIAKVNLFLDASKFSFVQGKVPSKLCWKGMLSSEKILKANKDIKKGSYISKGDFQE